MPSSSPIAAESVSASAPPSSFAMRSVAARSISTPENSVRVFMNREWFDRKGKGTQRETARPSSTRGGAINTQRHGCKEAETYTPAPGDHQHRVKSAGIEYLFAKSTGYVLSSQLGAPGGSYAHTIQLPLFDWSQCGLHSDASRQGRAFSSRWTENATAGRWSFQTRRGGRRRLRGANLAYLEPRCLVSGKAGAANV
jgi:hypothetical protein